MRSPRYGFATRSKDVGLLDEVEVLRTREEPHTSPFLHLVGGLPHRAAALWAVGATGLDLATSRSVLAVLSGPVDRRPSRVLTEHHLEGVGSEAVELRGLVAESLVVAEGSVTVPEFVVRLHLRGTPIVQPR